MCEDNMLFSHVKRSCFCAKAQLVFHWCLYDKDSYLICIIIFSGTQDEQIIREKVTYRIDGGCAALVALFLGKRLYVANAGDCRWDNNECH